MSTTPHIADLASLDRDVARAWTMLERWRRDVARDPAAHVDREPIEPWRHVAGQRTYDALGALTPVSFEVPHRDALRRWVAALTLARITREVEGERAEAELEASGRLDLGKPRMISWREAWRGLVAAEGRNEARAWLAAAAERGPALASLAKQRRERREEVSRRLGLPEDGSDAVGVSTAALATAAERLLDATDDIARTCLREARARLDLASEPVWPVDALRIALARDAPEGWPARLAPRWLEETFGAMTRGLRLEVAPLPSAHGGASFARALGAFGYALRVAGASPSLPFALARDPYFTGAHRFSDLFAALAASAAFQRRVLGNVARIADAQARVLGRTALFDTRLGAARFLLASAPRDRFGELTARLFGATMPDSLAGAWPAWRDDEPARLLARLTALPLVRTMVDRFDEDWFANPRAVQHLRALASAPARDAEEPPADLDGSARALARHFEETLG